MKRPALALLLALALSSPCALASDSEDLKRATAAYTEGMDLRASGHPSESADRLRQANRLYPTPITGLELGRGLLLLGKLVEAREALLAVARLGPRAGESARANTARAEAAALATELGERVPRVTFTHDASPPRVTVDGAPVADLDAPLRLDPGAHVVAWGTATRPITLAERQTVAIALAPERAPSAVPVAHEEPTPEAPSRALFWTGVGLTGAAVAAGTVAGLVAMGDANTARPSCPNDQCAPAVHGSADAAKTWANVSTASFVGAAVLGAATVVVYLVTGPSKTAPQVGSLALTFD